MPAFVLPLLRFLGRLALIATALVLGLVALGMWFSPSLRTEPLPIDAAQLAAELKLRDTTIDRNNMPVLQRDVDYAQGPAAPWYPKGESPLLSELVKEGKLPPVAERTGPEPLVMEGCEGIGTYGGTWIRVTNSAGDIGGTLSPRLSGCGLVRWSPLGYPIRPHLARGWSTNADKSEWTIYLRKGVRWSDGHPFTADDIMYWWDEERPLSKGQPKWLTVEGKLGNITKVDDYTIKFTFPGPYGTFLETLTANYAQGFLTPRHYLAQYHPTKGNKELIAATMKAEGSLTARGLYFAKKDARNPEHPRLWPWVYRTFRSSPPESVVRNPYYFVVDTKGNQLPYVDRILFDVKNPKLIPLSAAAGDLTLQERFIGFESYTMLMDNRKKNGYEVYHWFPAARSNWALYPNINRAVLPEDPASGNKKKLLSDKRFRQALSLAINRPEIIKAIYNGMGEPSQIAPGKDSEFHNEKLAKSYTDYDPARANKMLDELGLTQRDSDGMRCFADGTRMQFSIDMTDFAGEGPVQFITDDWAKVGVRAVQRNRARQLFSVEKNTFKHDFTVWIGEGEFNPIVEPRSFVASNSEAHWAPAHGNWYSRGGYYGDPTARPELAPPKDSDVYKGHTLYEQVLKTADRAEQVRLFNQIFDIAAENVWSISVATPSPQLVVVKNGFRNVPRNAISGYNFATPSTAGIETFYFEKTNDTPEAEKQIQKEVMTVTPAPFTFNAKTMKARTEGWSGVIWQMVLGAMALGIVYAGVKYPFIGRRLLVMIPTLAIMSVSTFYIIQMPPGDFIQTRILEARTMGDENAVENIERLRDAFFVDDPIWKQYLRWSGLLWFTTLNPVDRGLLQGELGKSMATQRSVNDSIGDRILLTIVVSLATIVFTWAVAMSVGIYSAVRQYTVGDYVMTFIAFIGMCIPNIVLAILIMYFSGKYLGMNVTGLFSPEYLTQPGWSVGKVIDMLKHIWVPVIVIAAGGTAGLIRVMRANLLDELRKPYVTTAMAKGKKPFPLLIKYPVRMALNPFISNIGGLLPGLISSGALVAIILSLPLVGPLLLDALQTEDVNMAASMLMILSMLSVLGTLMSDLMLLWLDPRIRFEGGSK
ncbi:hypothetical protein DB346_07905 [Verrucomicrobia bacterium LW23]|nr:hypothetical protein DB346_07905 [Verrucomicrobia bacterium LW23]